MWVEAGPREEAAFQAFLDRALADIAWARARVTQAAAAARGAGGLTRARPASRAAEDLLGLTFELSTLLLLLRAAREGDMPLASALNEAARLALAPVAVDGLGPALAGPAARVEQLRATLSGLRPAGADEGLPEGQGRIPQGHDGKREKPLRLLMGRPRLRLVVTNP